MKKALPVLARMASRTVIIHTAVSFASFFLITLVETRLNAALLGACPPGKMQDYPLHVLEALDELVKKQKEVNGLTQRIVGIDRDAGAFTQTVASVAA